MTNQTARVLELLKRFNDGKKVCIEALGNEVLWEGKSEKTIRRDLDVIKLVFPESFELIRGDKGCYKAITKGAFENFLTPETISMMAQVYNVAQKSNLFSNIDLCESDKKLLESQLKKSKDCYMFIDKPYENKKSDYQLFKEMENAIYYQQHLMVKYTVNDKTEVMDIKPYKILFINQNFYLVCEVVDSQYELTQLRTSNITQAQMLSKQFHKNYEIEDFIKEIQTPFSTYKSGYKKYMTEVIVEVKNEKTRFFKAKNFLPSQRIVEQKADGSLVLSFKVTQELEIEELIKKWLPHMRVIEPLSLKEKIENELREYLLLA
jgi:predicted DNA-binding transcriptional regulator YafY